MSTYERLRLLEILVWPTVALVGLLLVRPHFSTLLGGAKIKLNFGGQSIETTLPELKQILEDQGAEALSEAHVTYLTTLVRQGTKRYPPGIDNADEREFLRPLRNSGLILAVPRNEHLSRAKAIEISGLGRLYLRALGTSSKSST